MADTSLIQTIVSGVVSGGAGAATTLLAFFRDMRNRIEKLEKTVGTPGSAVEPRTGLFLLVAQLGDSIKIVEDGLKRFRREIDGWQDDPPDWFVRALNRRVTSMPTADDMTSLEERVEMRMKTAIDRLKRLEDALAQLQGHVEALPDTRGNFVDTETYEQESQKRAEEIRKIQDNLHTANGFLRGVMAALGYLDPPQTSPTPPPFPRRK